ncbi:DUF1338 domain-containing protein [Echinimonas agarilytica]|uniref:2-oxoadipate dioxygenase/decarboxylase n=2 Tax=Echinimonas agarilytica TaxID=1215918 RepID=A0AA41W3X9_9GAMM|nr:DUF1338 domain-containing protein [Echinimonas agarilytica]
MPATLIFDNLWRQFLQVTPSAERIHELLAANSTIVNDHIALRTFNHPKVNIDVIARPFLKVGYTSCGHYEFKTKKLVAQHFEHPDPLLPKVFISELLLEQCSLSLQHIANGLIEQVAADTPLRDDFVFSGTPWKVDQAGYYALLEESEYAGWLAAWGYRANHFTVSVNHLDNFERLEDVNRALMAQGFVLNLGGGRIKGTPEELLEQSSTMADTAFCEFSDGVLEIPSCFYEFARRYADQQGEIYTGFIAASADKIFESTHKN